MPWSIFTQGGGSGAAVTWAQDLLGQASQQWGVNVNTPALRQFVYDWEVSEGGGGKYNPLNQGPVPGQSQLTTTGQQYGGGAADFASVQAGLTGALDYLDMPAYAGVKAAMEAGNAQAAEQALWQSSWAGSHYGYGSAWNTSALPGQASAIVGSSTSTGDTSSGNNANTGSTGDNSNNGGIGGFQLTSTGGGLLGGILGYILGPAAGLSDVGKIAAEAGTFLGIGGTAQPQAVSSNGFLNSMDELLNPSISLFNPWKAITMFLARGGVVALGFMLILSGVAILTFGTSMGRDMVGGAVKTALAVA